MNAPHLPLLISSEDFERFKQEFTAAYGFEYLSNLQSQSDYKLPVLTWENGGVVWDQNRVLVYSPLFEGETKDAAWLATAALDCVQDNYRAFKCRTDPESLAVVSYRTMCDAFEPAAGPLTQEQYNLWRAQYERKQISAHVATGAPGSTRKM